MYRQLDPDLVIDTTDRLRQRVVGHFPDAGLGGVAGELREVAREVASTARWLDQPHWGLRISTIACVLVLTALVFGVLLNVAWSDRFSTSVSEFFQGLEAAINDLIFFGAAALFLATWEKRIKRRRALRVLHQLRSLAHVIDMHQLAKDPGSFGTAVERPDARILPPKELGLYLDFCSEMLSVIGKLAAVLIQRFDDSVTLAAVDEIESLTMGLSRKIWQKISILSRVADSPGAETPDAAS